MRWTAARCGSARRSTRTSGSTTCRSWRTSTCSRARVIINSRTGTIVIGQNVKVSPAAVTHGSLTVSITEDPIVSQPGAFSNGQTAVVPRSRVNAEEETKPMFKFGPGTTLDDIVRAVNQVGAAPSDLMAILEALKQAGALQADLIVI